jgi:hypothetical protein
MWQTVINGIKRLLGINPLRIGQVGEETNAYNVVNNALETLLDEYNGKLYDDYINQAQYSEEVPFENRVEEWSIADSKTVKRYKPGEKNYVA